MESVWKWKASWRWGTQVMIQNIIIIILLLQKTCSTSSIGSNISLMVSAWRTRELLNKPSSSVWFVIVNYNHLSACGITWQEANTFRKHLRRRGRYLVFWRNSNRFGIYHRIHQSQWQEKKYHPMYTCSLDGCKSAWGSSYDMFYHVKNYKHQRNLFKEIDPEFSRIMSKNLLLDKAVRKWNWRWS